MPLTLSKKADFTVAECDGELTIFNVAEVHKQLEPIIKNAPDKLILDLTAIQDFDSAGFQLLYWLKMQMPETTQVICSFEENAAVQRLLNLYQLDADFSPLQKQVGE